MKLKELLEIDDIKEYYSGTVLRNFYTNDEFYDYLLVYVPWEKGMLLVNITENDSKKGLAYGGIIPFCNETKFAVNKIGFKYTLGNELKDWYLNE